MFLMFLKMSAYVVVVVTGASVVVATVVLVVATVVGVVAMLGATVGTDNFNPDVPYIYLENVYNSCHFYYVDYVEIKKILKIIFTSW